MTLRGMEGRQGGGDWGRGAHAPRNTHPGEEEALQSLALRMRPGRWFDRGA